MMARRRGGYRSGVTRDDRPDDPFRVLGLTPGCTPADVVASRRRLSKRAHPDAGGDVDAMQRINNAADELLHQLGVGERRSTKTAPTPPTGARYDHPSFTVEALPAVTFEGLTLVAGWLGELIDDEPPYVLDVALAAPVRGWCRLEVAPDAGASTVSVAVAGEPGWPVPDLDRVRDAWIDGLNQLDWDDADGPRQRLC
jgi:hypothetical protein